jgi:hypothetical protein
MPGTTVPGPAFESAARYDWRRRRQTNPIRPLSAVATSANEPGSGAATAICEYTAMQQCAGVNFLETTVVTRISAKSKCPVRFRPSDTPNARQPRVPADTA